MKRLLLLFIICGLNAVYAQTIQPKRSGRVFIMPQGITLKDYLPGIIIVKFKPRPSAVYKSQADSNSVPQIKLQGVKLISVRQKFNTKPAESSARVVLDETDPSGLDRIYELKFSGSEKIEEVINELLKDDRIEYAEPEYLYHNSYAPNDPGYVSNSQSYLSQVKAPQAWDIIRNSSGVIIAIVDSGSDLLHQDLAANIYLNTADPVNGIDDDHDGYVDNYQGWDFMGASASQPREDNDPNVKSDTTDHGVHVSGIASAVSDNGVGVASIAFNAKLMIIKAGADNDASTIYKGYEGIKYAADHHAQIINCSWGGSAGGSFGSDVINYAISKGCLVTAAAGNSSASEPDYPAGYPGVMAVASVNSNDVKSGSSNYGSYVSISAPGSTILSTLPFNKYGQKSGTSMSAPVVASAAALVKSYFPNLNMQQVGEQLRATADNIDTQNPTYAGLLGRGRLNVYRALTELLPSVRNQKTTVNDKGTGNLNPGDTVLLFFDLKNFLLPAAGLTVSLSSKNPNVVFLNARQTIASLGMLETKTGVGPFSLIIKPNTPDNTVINFRIDYAANNGAYQDFESFNLTVALDYLNIQVNKVQTTMTSNGRVGYSSANAVNGLGFIYNQVPTLFEASLMIGNSADRVSNNARTGTGSSEHFIKQVRAARVSGTNAAFEGHSEFNDSGSPAPLNIYINHRQLAYAQAPDDKYTIAEYEVFNTNSTDLTGVYIGMFTDWDIDDGNNNVTKYDAVNKIGYTFRKTGGSPYGAVKLLSATAAPAYYPMSAAVPGDLLSDGVFSDADKFQTLSNGIKALSLGESSATGSDVMFVSGYGPYAIPAKGSVKVAFAFIGGDDLADIQRSAAAAQIKYDSVLTASRFANKMHLFQNFPNPVTTSTTIKYFIPNNGQVTLSLYNLGGKRIKTYYTEFEGAGMHTYNINPFDLQSGLYIYRLRYNNEQQALRMSVLR